MPEGHTIHRLAIDLNRSFGGREVRVSSPQGRFSESAALLSTLHFHGAQAHGKHLFVGFDAEPAHALPGAEGGLEPELHLGPDAQWLHIHLGLIGSLRFGPPTPPQGAVRVRLETDECAADLRGPQTCRLATTEEMAAQMALLGPDPLRRDADPERGWRRVHASAKPIAALVMDQKVLSGVGNVYRAEVLFRNRINPFRPGRQLSRRRWDEIWTDLATLMPQGVLDNRIDTVRPEHTPEAMGRPPRVDDHGGEVYVYRRNGMPCYVCGSMIKTKVVEGRNLFWCGRCQRRG